MTRGEVASVLGISERKLDKMRHDGDLPSVRIGSAVRIPRSAVVEFIDAVTARAATTDGAA